MPDAPEAACSDADWACETRVPKAALAPPANTTSVTKIVEAKTKALPTTSKPTEAPAPSTVKKTAVTCYKYSFERRIVVLVNQEHAKEIITNFSHDRPNGKRFSLVIRLSYHLDTAKISLICSSRRSAPMPIRLKFQISLLLGQLFITL